MLLMSIGNDGDEPEHEVPLPLIELFYGVSFLDVADGLLDLFQVISSPSSC
jgi:hypothetical protein